MSILKHTPGPWHITKDEVKGIPGAEVSKLTTSVGASKKSIGKIHATHKEEGAANAALAVKSPEMYYELRSLIGVVDQLMKTEGRIIGRKELRQRYDRAVLLIKEIESI